MGTRRRAGRTRPGRPTRRRTSSRSRSAGWASRGPTRSGGGTSRRRRGRRRARTPGRTIGGLAGGGLGLGLRHLVAEHRLVGPGGGELLEPARDDVEPRRDVAAARQREPQVERADLAHEGAVLVPGAADGRLGLAERRLLDRDEWRLAEVARDEVRDAGGREQLQHLEAQVRRVDREDATALLDPGAVVDRVEASVGLELLVPPRRAATVALSERALDAVGEGQRGVARDEAAHEQAAVAQDARAQQLWIEVGGGDLRQPLRLGQALGGRPRELRVGRRLVEQADAGLMAEPQHLALGGGVARVAVELGEARDLGEEILGRRFAAPQLQPEHAPAN